MHRIEAIRRTQAFSVLFFLSLRLICLIHICNFVFEHRYIFETLGYLVASIIISSVQFLKKINENGIKKM